MLSWIKLNQTVNIFPTNKLFYNKFLFKVKIYCPGSRLIHSKSVQELESRLDSRKKLYSGVSYNYGGSWFKTTLSQNFLDDVNLDHLIHFFNIKNNSCNNVKIRLEEPFVNLYSNDENELYNHAMGIDGERVLEIHRPKTDNTRKVLLAGEIVSKKNENYQYKLYLRAVVFNNISTKQSLLDYLYNLKEHVKLTKSVITNLNSNLHRFPGGYLYINDPQIITFISLICPEIISKIFKLTKVE